MMKQQWSKRWISSVQPRKQRKYRYNAPLHIRQGFVSAPLSKTLRERFGKRNIPLRKGDEIEVMRGTFRGQRGVVDRVDLSGTKIYVDEIKVKKSDGSEVMRALQPSNLRIVKLNLDDKKRQAVFDRASKPTDTKKNEPGEKKEKSNEKKKEKKPAPKAHAPKTKKAPVRKTVKNSPKKAAKKPDPKAKAKKAAPKKPTKKGGKK